MRDQAPKYKWDEYNKGSVAQDPIFIQTSNTKLQRKIIAKDISFEDTVKFGLVMELRYRKVKELGMNQREKED